MKSNKTNNQNQSKLLRIGVFYDGNYFMQVSNYYKFGHARRSRISVPGLHSFIRDKVAREEGVDFQRCQIVDAHFFRGRFSAKAADERQQLYNDRVLDDILMGEGVITHYLPMRENGEKGIDVWFALEAYELTLHKQFDVIVLIAGDGDFVPLVRKINSLGTRIMILGWNFTSTNFNGDSFHTATSRKLLEEVSYPVLMEDVIGDAPRGNDVLIEGVFVDPRNGRDFQDFVEASIERIRANEKPGILSDESLAHFLPTERFRGEIISIRPQEGFGFIKTPQFPNNLFFRFSDFVNVLVKEYVSVGEEVTFSVGSNERGAIATKIELDVKAEGVRPKDRKSPLSSHTKPE